MSFPKWRVKRLTKYRGCVHDGDCGREVQFFHVGADYVSFLCEDHLENYCAMCKKPTLYAKDCCEEHYKLPCIYSACEKGLPAKRVVESDLLSWALVFKRKCSFLKKDIFRLVLSHLKQPHRECVWCGPGVWHLESKLTLLKQPRYHVWCCKKHIEKIELRFEIDDHKFCKHEEFDRKISHLDPFIQAVTYNPWPAFFGPIAQERPTNPYEVRSNKFVLPKK